MGSLGMGSLAQCPLVLALRGVMGADPET
jgi:hypothetical protein